MEVLYSQKGTRGMVDNFSIIDTVQIIMDYLEIPVLFVYEFPVPGVVKPSVFLGPSMAVKLSAKAKSDDNQGLLAEEADIYNVRGVNFGLVMGTGLGIVLGAGKIIFDARYSLSLSRAFKNVNDVEDIPDDEIAFIYNDGKATDLKHGGFSFMLGYGF